MSEKLDTVIEKPKMSVNIGDEEFRILMKDDEDFIENKFKEIEDFMISNDGEGKDDKEKDNLYLTAQNLWAEVAGKSGKMNDIAYKLLLNKRQYNYLTTLLLQKMEYDVNTLFFIIPLTDYLASMSGKGKEYENEDHLIGFDITATDMTYLYHILSQNKVKGLNRNTYTFAEIIRRIGDISKIINYYENESKELSTEIMDWVQLFDNRIKMEDSGKNEDVIDEVKSLTTENTK